MKKIIFKNGLTVALLLLAGANYSQTNNTIGVISSASGTSNGGTITYNVNTGNTTTAVTTNNPALTVDATTTGFVTIAGAQSKAIPFTYTAGILMDPTTGAIITPGGINRSAAGDLGVQATTENLAATPPIAANPSPSTGVDVGEGYTFSFNTTSIGSTITILQITKIYLTTFGTAESAKIINMLDPTKTLTVTGASNGLATIDVTNLAMYLNPLTAATPMLSIQNNSSTAQNWRVKQIEFKFITRSTWEGGPTWVGGTPNADREAIINASTNTLATSQFVCAKLTINPGFSLNIESGRSIRVANQIINNAGPTGIVVENGGLLRQDNANSINIGAITVNKNSNSLLRLDYTMWSSPVNGAQTLAQFSPLTSQAPNRFYTYNGGTNFYSNIDPLTTTFAPGSGYLIRMPNDAAATATPYAGVFTGVPNNGTITLNGLAPDTFYSVGNPYPNTLNTALFLTGNSTDGTLYFWRKTNTVVNTAPGNGTSYATRTSIGGTASGSVAPNEISPTGDIAVGQGFIVKTGPAATSLTFTNAMRTNVAATPFFKTNVASTPDRVWLNLTNSTGAFSQALIAYVDAATLGVDNGIDGESINDSSLALTSNINNKEYTIQGRPTFNANDVVALNFKTAIAGDYTIAIDHFDGLFAAGQDIYLADSKTGVETDLKAGPYNFTAAVGVDNNRFTLKYQKTLKVIGAEFNDNNVTVYAKNGILYVNAGANSISNVKVFDIQGRLVSEQKNVKSNTATISNLGVNQALIVQVSSEDNKVISKKILN